MARIIKNSAGSYKVVRPDGTVMAIIENQDVAELSSREWLVTFYRYDLGLGVWVEGDGEVVPTLKAGKVLAFDHARALMQTLAGY